VDGGVTKLLERERELGALSDAVAELAGGRGRALVLEGPAGIGKTALLDVLCARAEQVGARVLRARGGELEIDDQFGVVRQLLHGPLASGELRELPRSAAGALDAGDATPAPPGEDAAHAAHHALFELCGRLAGERPLLLAVDDAHWSDARSLRWLLFLTRRLERTPILLALTRRPDEPGSERALLERVAAQPEAVTIEPVPLSHEATEQLVRRAMGAGAAEEFCAACQRATGGNPFLLGELLGELLESGVEPTAEAAATALAVGPASVARATLLRLSRAPTAALALARALAVLEESELRDAAALAGIDGERASAAASALAKAGLLAPGQRLRFAHPLVRSAIYQELDEHERADAHRRAAAVLRSAGASAEKVAAHLLLAPPAGEPVAVASLRDAARRAYTSGAPDAAAAYLRRALLEPPAERQRAEVLFELGRAEVRASEPEAVDHLEAASAALVQGPALARVLRELARAHMRNGRMPEATVAFERAASCAVEDRELLLAIEGELAATLANVTGAADAQERLAGYGELPGQTPAERTVLAVLAFASVQQNRPARTAIELMERVLRDGHFVREQTASTVVFADAILGLIIAGGERLALECLEDALADARRLGWTIGLSAAPFYQAWAELRLGRLGAAKERALASLAVSDERGWQAFTPMAAAVLCEAELELGDLPAAAIALERAGLGEEVPDSSLFQLALYARGLLRARAGEARAALADLLLCGERELTLGGVTPAAMAWRSNAALLRLSLGEREAALVLAREEVELARVLGAPRALGVSLRALGVVEGGDEGTEMLREAVELLAGGDAGLEHARALCELGAALRRGNRRRDARAPLREALARADELDARPIAQRAREELLAAGGRPRRVALSGPDALTASERRTAMLAAAGRSNREIAAELVVTVRTVEFHLSRAYGKLGVSSREELREGLGLETQGSA
jgi:DNA-binding CsgD family transcriptional regulator